jgi:hypothetical protein
MQGTGGGMRGPKRPNAVTATVQCSALRERVALHCKKIHCFEGHRPAGTSARRYFRAHENRINVRPSEPLEVLLPPVF